MNREFQEGATQLADALDLDEIDSARLLLESQEDAEILNRSNVASALAQFHERRNLLLECLRLLLRQSTDLDCEKDVRDVSRQLIGLILETKDGPARNGSLYTQKCLRVMAAIEQGLQALEERYQGTLALGQTLTPEYEEMRNFQRLSLGQQHESMAAIINHLVKANQTGVEDFYKLLEHLPKLDRWNDVAVHYVPVIIAFTSQYGSMDASGTLREARALNSKIVDSKDTSPWNLRNLQAATITWWLAEYSGWYLEQPTGSPVLGVNFEAEAQSRSEAFFQALQDGAFHCTLSICSHFAPGDWYDPAKKSLMELLLQDSQPPSQDSAPTSVYFQKMIMEQFESFADAFISNMPDTLRRFKSEEDDQRKRIRSGLLANVPGSIPEQSLHLERFLIIISFSFDRRIDAAQSFWSDLDSNLYGFLHWASKRQSTPCVGAFCEMLRSISEGNDCAASAHRFLLEESQTTTAKIRRSSSLSWAQIFGELTVYTSRVPEQPMAIRPPNQYGRKQGPDEIEEPESSVMLESYLRLTAHLCRESAEVRSWIISQPEFSILDVLFSLCNSPIPSPSPSRLPACAFNVIRSLLTDKALESGMAVWMSLDQWVSGQYFPASISRPSKATNPAAWAEEVTFETVAADLERANEFISLLLGLVSPAALDTGLNDQLPFPETLGSTYRMPGIEPYVDFVLGRMFPSIDQMSKEHNEDNILQKTVKWNILSFALTCLTTFNEDLVILANRSIISVDEAMNTSSLVTYVRLHPFYRVMEWMFNESVLNALFASAHEDVENVASAAPGSPLIGALLRSIEVMNLIMDLQSTYLDIVRPLIKSQSASCKKSVHNPSLASFEDSVALNLKLVVNLGLYSGIGNHDLAVASLKLLEKIGSSRKLNIQSAPGLSQRVHGNRLISAVEENNDLDRIARSLTLAMQFDWRELSQGPLSQAWTIKTVILDFLINCLSASPDRPTLAHAFLGFACTSTTLDVEASSLFAQSSSLFHAIVRLTVEYPDGDGDMMQAWSLSLKQKGMQVLSILWTSPLTSVFTLVELRASDFLFALFLRQMSMEPGTEWDGRSVKDPDFMYTESSETLEHCLWQRCSLLEYASTEIRLVAAEGVPSLKARIFSTLFGTTSLPDGEQVPNPTVFDLLDFIELNITNSIPFPQLNYFEGLDFSISAGAGFPKPANFYDLKVVGEIVTLRMNELRKGARIQDPNEEQRANAEAEHILLYFQSENSKLGLSASRMQTLKAWADLLTLAIGTCDLDSAGKAALILQALQLVTPKLDEFAITNIQEAIDIAKVILALLFQFDFRSSALELSRAGDVANDRLFQVFRTALRAVNCPDESMQLREVLYKICYRYLAGMSGVPDTPIRRRHGTQTVKVTGEKTIDIICDDGYGASGSCRISALLLLDALAGLAKVDNSNYIIESLVRTNFIQVLVESVESIPQELRETNANGEWSYGALISVVLTQGVN